MSDHADASSLPEPAPADTARLDQLAAHWRELPEVLQQDVTQAAEQLRDAPSEDAAARLFTALRAAGLDAGSPDASER
ncbi:hypothetical protein H3146_03985 [Streptomyces sp. OF3]|uniref:Uncharacterized protein n=1 Tax=Streptomyces alkaliterrae TaxID=2213162 RepID=A0A7W3ZLJ5_9ACTN|nr:hypothetical protein [Streptomyces alkaliterrae]MBB1252535.1 hypothetical protein [Streptomyces alkaliterrae]